MLLFQYSGHNSSNVFSYLHVYYWAIVILSSQIAYEATMLHYVLGRLIANLSEAVK